MIGMPIELVALYYTILEFVRSIDMTSQNQFIFWSSALGAISSIGILVMGIILMLAKSAVRVTPLSLHQ